MGLGLDFGKEGRARDHRTRWFDGEGRRIGIGIGALEMEVELEVEEVPGGGGP